MQFRSRTPSRIFRSLTAPTNLNKTYTTYVQGGTARGRDGVEPQALERDISAVSALVSRKTRGGTYRFTSYRQLLISKGASRFPRIISIPTARDRIVLKSMASLIESVFPVSRGKVPQAKVAELQRALKSNRFDGFVRLDIENFYPTISHEAVMNMVRQKIRKPEILALIQDAIATPTLADQAPRSDARAARGVPQGLPISNLLAEIAMQEVDGKFGNDTGTFYLRYVDDIIILCNQNQAEKICDEVVAACRAISLTVHDPKIPGSKSSLGLVSGSIDYLGYVFSPTKISVRPESVSNLKASIARVFTRYKYEVAGGEGDAAGELKARTECLWKLNLVITGCVFDGQRRGWIHYFSQIDDLSTLKGLDATVRNFARRFGLNDDFQPKSFTRAFWRINKNDTSGEPYIPDFDTYSPMQKRQLLTEVFHVKDAERFSDELASRVFYTEVKRLVDKLEQDVSGLS